MYLAVSKGTEGRIPVERNDDIMDEERWRQDKRMTE
jgi:hypothetical protein